MADWIVGLSQGDMETFDDMAESIRNTITAELRLQTRAIVRAVLVASEDNDAWVRSAEDIVLHGVYGPDAEDESEPQTGEGQ